MASPPVFVDFGLGLAALVFEDVGDYDFRAFAGEEFGFGGSHAPGSAGDEGDFALLVSLWSS